MTESQQSSGLLSILKLIKNVNQTGYRTASFRDEFGKKHFGIVKNAFYEVNDRLCNIKITNTSTMTYERMEGCRDKETYLL